MRALIVGAGIGGLSSALALRRQGIEVTVYERAAELREVGAGLAIAPNAMRALGVLGLSGTAREIGASPRFYEIRSWRGEVLSRVSMPELEQRLGAATVAVHRAELQRALLGALEEAGGEVKLGARCVGFEQDSEGVTALFADGRRERGDLLVGADGLHSTVRKRLLGDGLPRYAGYTVWRAVVRPGGEFVSAPVSTESWGRGLRFLYAPIGRERVYWAACKNAPEGEYDAPAGAAKESLLKDFRGWHAPVEALVRSTDEQAILRTAIYDRKPARRWGEGRVTLLGDAAHPMTPDLGQGACQAIEDAVALARSLREENAAVPALRLYESRRIPRTAALVRRSRRLGRVAQSEILFLCKIRDIFLKTVPDQMLMRQTANLLAYEQRPS